MNVEKESHPIEIIFWGVRGSKPSPNKSTLSFGGNTSCVQVQMNNRTIIFDGGTGLCELGNHFVKLQKNSPGIPITADIFFSHLHWDHIQGLPFFSPLYEKGNQFRLFGEHKQNLSFQEVIEMQMKPPHFPITMKMMKADYQFHEISCDQVLDLEDGITITTFAVNHPNGCLAYRLHYGPHSLVYCTDTEPMTEDKLDSFLLFIKDTDVFIYDCHYQLEEYLGLTDGPSKKGWGHSTWEEGVRLSQLANVGHFVLFHHKENRTDEDQLLIEKQARALFSNSVAAREGMKITIGGDLHEKVVISYS